MSEAGRCRLVCQLVKTRFRGCTLVSCRPSLYNTVDGWVRKPADAKSGLNGRQVWYLIGQGTASEVTEAQ